MAKTLSLHADRALPAEPGQLAIAREIYTAISSLPLVSMHGHVDVQDIRDNAAFGDPTELFVLPDHYLRRMLVSQGYGNHELGIAPLDPNSDLVAETDHRRICSNARNSTSARSSTGSISRS
jgi:glucuronate isomerase